MFKVVLDIIFIFYRFCFPDQPSFPGMANSTMVTEFLKDFDDV